MTEEPAATTIPDGQAIRAQFESTRDEYMELLRSLSEADWKHKSANPVWTVRHLMWHLAWGAAHFPAAIEACRNGKAPNPPRWLMNPVNVVITRIGAKNATPASAGAKYEAAHAAILTCIDGVRDDEWKKGVKFTGRYTTIEGSFARFRDHFDEHKADILNGLGRG